MRETLPAGGRHDTGLFARPWAALRALSAVRLDPSVSSSSRLRRVRPMTRPSGAGRPAAAIAVQAEVVATAHGLIVGARARRPIRPSWCGRASRTRRRRSASCAGSRPRRRRAWKGVRDAKAVLARLLAAGRNPGVVLRRRAARARRGLPLPQRVERGQGASDEARPVMVWIHGGALATGTGSMPCVRRHRAGAEGRRAGDHQLPSRAARASSRIRRCPPSRSTVVGQLRHPRSDRGAAMGAATTSRRSAAIRPTSPSSASRPARGASATCRRRRSRAVSSIARSARAAASSVRCRAAAPRKAAPRAARRAVETSSRPRRRASASPRRSGRRRGDRGAALRAKTPEEIYDTMAKARRDGHVLVPPQRRRLGLSDRRSTTCSRPPALRRPAHGRLQRRRRDRAVGSDRAHHGRRLSQGGREPLRRLRPRDARRLPAPADADAKAAFLTLQGDDVFAWQMRTWARLASASGTSPLTSTSSVACRPAPRARPTARTTPPRSSTRSTT